LRANAILVVFCFPFLDLRYLTTDARFGRPRWHWPPSEDHRRVEFVGELGRVLRVVASSRPGALDLRGAIRFGSEARPAWQSLAGRYLYADNAGQVQAHIGFVTRASADLPALLESLGRAQVEVRRSPDGPGSLDAAGLSLAERYLFYTSLTSDPRPEPRPQLPLPRLVREGAGSPFLVLVSEPGEVTPPPEALVFLGHGRLAGDAVSWSGPVGDQTLDIWLLPMARRPAGTRMMVVQSLCRIVGWVQELAILQRVAADPSGISLDSAQVERFVRDRAGKLRGKERESWPVEPVLARVNRLTSAHEAGRAAFAAAVGPLLLPEVRNDVLATLGRVDLHRDALEVEAGWETGAEEPARLAEATRAIADRAAGAPRGGEGELGAILHRLEVRADAVDHPLVPSEEVRRLHAALVRAELAADRDTLLAGLEPELVASLERAAQPKAQLLRDLMALNRAAPSQALGEAPPLVAVLHNAALVARNPERAKEIADWARAIQARLLPPFRPSV
jgi:hypothetical protein